MTTTHQAPRRRRIAESFDFRAFLLIALLWVMLWGDLSVGNVVNGLLIGLLVTLALRMPRIDYAGRVRPLRLIGLIGRFMWDLTVATAQVVSIAVRPGHPTGSIVEVTLRTTSPLYMTIVSAMVSLTPGSVVMDTRRHANAIYVHEITATTPEAVESARQSTLAIERRVVRALGSRAEIQLVEEGR